MGSIEKIYQELKIAKITMEASNQQIKYLNDRIEALQRHHKSKMDQAMRIIKRLRNGEAKTIQE